MFERPFVQFSSSAGSVSLVGASIFADGADFPGIGIAANNLGKDFGRVTGQDSSIVLLPSDADLVSSDLMPSGRSAIIVGSVTSSRLIQDLGRRGKLNLAGIRGKWESFRTDIIDQPFPNCDKALVISGSDKRGAIFGIYTISEQIGVSPWYWWADVPSMQRTEIYATPTSTVNGEPSVRYRGIFLNDEAPAMTGWVMEKYGSYNSEFYKQVFELLLRLKANLLWPAMWPGYPNPGASFFTDDPVTQRLADEYGIVISTSHHEPMQRLSNEWFQDNPDGSWNWMTNKDAIVNFFKGGAERARAYESYFTLGMRGEYDKKMDCDDPVSIVNDVIKVQRRTIREVYGEEDAVPQLLAIYKEVQTLFETGQLEIPEDVTLLFQDDNFGTIRRLPTSGEAKRKGGAGIYYHLEYVGSPRSYKWMNSNSLGKIWHQLRQAYNRSANTIWIFNVGDLKPLEMPITFSLAVAWNIQSIEYDDGLEKFYTAFARREFGPDLAGDISCVWNKFDRLVSIRKHEHIEPASFSILHYNEADLIYRRWKELLEKAEDIQGRVSLEQKAAAFQLILHPVKASYTYVALQITRARNQLYARQRRNSANTTASMALKLFDEDFDLSEEFHSLSGAKWNHMMAQPHYGYEETWHAPSRDMINGLGWVQRRQNSNPIVGQMGVCVEGHEGVRTGLINEESERTHPSRRDLVPGFTLGLMSRYGPRTRWFELFTRGKPLIEWSASTSHEWMKLSITAGTLEPGEDDARIELTIEWDQVPESFEETAIVAVRSTIGDLEHIHVPVTGRVVPSKFGSGFIEGDGCVSMPASLCKLPQDYVALPHVGRLETGSIALRSSLEGDDGGSYLEYPFFVFTTAADVSILLYFGTTLDVSPEDVLSYEIKLDAEGSTVQALHNPDKDSLRNAADHGWPTAPGWLVAASDNVWIRRHAASIIPGEHILRIKLRHPNMLLEKIVIDCGGVQSSYLGPPPSVFISR